MKITKKLLCIVVSLSILLMTSTFNPIFVSAEESSVEQPYVRNELLLTFSNTLFDSNLVADEISDTVLENLDTTSTYTVLILESCSVNENTSVYMVSLSNAADDSVDIIELCDSINSSNVGIYAMPNYILTPDEIEFNENVGLNVDDFDVSFIEGNLLPGWHIRDTFLEGTEDFCENLGDEIVVAVIDSGCDFSHEHLQNSSVSFRIGSTVHHGFNFSDLGGLYDITDNYGHGTWVASVITGSNSTNNIPGIAPNAKILPIKIANGEDDYYLSKLLKAIDMIAFYNEYVAERYDDSPAKVSVVNMSVSFMEDAVLKDINCPIKIALDKLAEDCILVASAGNTGTGVLSEASECNFPAGFDSVLGVMAYGEGGKMAPSSSYDITGQYYEITAPGVAISLAHPSTINGYAIGSGTSFAAPIVAGAIALYLSNCPNISYEQAKNDLLTTMTDTVQPYHSLDCEHLKLNILDYLNKGLLNDESIFTGMCGDDAVWTYTHSNKSLVISGEGEIYDYLRKEAPWYRFRRLITSCIISDGITRVGENTFIDLTTLENLVIGNDVESIGMLAFSYCKKLLAINIPDSTTELGTGAFFGCINATSLSLPMSISAYSGDCIFQKCSALTEISIPENWTYLPSGIFMDCVSLENVTLPDSITTIELTAFKNCFELSNINMPSNLTKIRSQSFANCISLTSLVLPRSLEAIDGKAFSGCTNLVSITLYDNITTMRANIFENCPNVVVKAYINSIPLTYAQTNNISYEIIYRLNPLEGSTTVFDRGNERILGLKPSLIKRAFEKQFTQLDEGFSLEYESTNVRYLGTNSIVKVMKGETVVETYKILIFGELNGDGRITANDTTIMYEIISGTYVLAEGSLVEIAADIYQHGSGVTVDDIDLMNQIIAGLYDLPQNLYTPV